MSKSFSKMQCWSKKINPSQELDVFQGSFRSVWSCSWWTEKKSTDVMWNVQLSCSLKTCNSLIVPQPYFNVSLRTINVDQNRPLRTRGFFDVCWLGRKMTKRLFVLEIKLTLWLTYWTLYHWHLCWTVVVRAKVRYSLSYMVFHTDYQEWILQ